ncbi:4Fe-4S binding protein [Anaerosacchariphilus polymeriproducens]|uniref:4Fe-4S dicluster domain-containing protein n=1 Tax=Anaerosacchariphilus polymeriproducens TaxID=1812858 RepID=A0A371AZE1_9FIRM|nr:4Fe-4S dicluster domain-containing protein [Anaerosacchariphilus polymeriproducens]RDU24926.1 4Fe-4S dicluster domain-containing protein [Anaerosacchariphilus polymeriproducens]
MFKKIRLKKFIQYLALILFPVTINYFSPYLIMVGATKGIVNGSMILFGSLLISSILFGRLFCSTLCPVGAAGDYLCFSNERRVKNGKFNLIKWFIWIPWLAGIIAGLLYAGGISEVNPLFMTETGISVDRPGAYIIYLGVLALVTIISITVGKRAFCHYVCWMAPFMIIGIHIRSFFRLPGFTLTAKKETCIKCGKCNNVCPMSLDIREMVQMNKMTHVECILCGQCVKQCPKDTIDFGFERGKLNYK